MKSLFLFLGIVLFTSCTSTSGPVSDTNIVVDLSAPEPQVVIKKIVPLETSSETFYDRFFKIDQDGSHIFVQDRSRILVFDTTGRYLSRLERPGKGPQEYTYLINACPFGDELYVIRGDTKTIGVYSLDGRFIRSIQLDFQPLDLCVTDDYMAFQVASTAPNTLIVTDRAGNRLYEAVAPVSMQGSFEMAALHPFTRTAEGVFYFPNYIFDVYRLGRQESELQLVAFDFGSYSLTADYLSQFATPEELNRQARQDGMATFLNFQPAARWWNLNFYRSGVQYGWFYDTSTGRQYIVSKADNSLAGQTVSTTAGDNFVVAVEALDFLENPIFVPWHEQVSVGEEDNAVLIYYTIEE